MLDSRQGWGPTTRRALALVALLGLVASASPLEAAKRRRPRPRPAPLQAIWHVETLDGRVVDSREGDAQVNPASVIKVATSLWAIERLGPQHRFETRFAARGDVDLEKGEIRGDLVVTGSADPDFQVENAFLVAAELNELGIRTVRGSVVVNARFWIGHENGSQGTIADDQRRALLMASRLRQAMDPQRWSGSLRHAWRAFAERTGRDAVHPPRVRVLGPLATDEQPAGELLLVHRSSPLSTILRRFNCFSNNDIERVAESLGPPEELAGLLRVRCDAPLDQVRLDTTSGLGTNRLTPRLIVRLLREFRASCLRMGLPVEALLPVSGCDPGTVSRFFPQFNLSSYATSLVGKTGTLTSTDGGVSVLAGFLNTAEGEMVFSIAVPRSGGRLNTARQAEQRFLVELADAHGGPAPRACAPPLPDPAEGADVIPVLVQRTAAAAAGPVVIAVE